MESGEELRCWQSATLLEKGKSQLLQCMLLAFTGQMCHVDAFAQPSRKVILRKLTEAMDMQATGRKKGMYARARVCW